MYYWTLKWRNRHYCVSHREGILATLPDFKIYNNPWLHDPSLSNTTALELLDGDTTLSCIVGVRTYSSLINAIPGSSEIYRHVVYFMFPLTLLCHFYLFCSPAIHFLSFPLSFPFLYLLWACSPILIYSFWWPWPLLKFIIQKSIDFWSRCHSS